MMVPHDNWIIQNSLRPEKPVAEEKLAKPGAGGAPESITQLPEARHR